MPFWRFRRRARAASCATVRPPVSSMKNGRCCSSIATSLIFSKSRSLMPPRRIVLDGMPLCSAMIRVASCSADISSEKKPTMPPLTVVIWPSGLHLAAPGARDVVGDVGGERGLAHAGAAGDDDQVGRLQAAHLAVEVAAGRSRARTACRRAGRRAPPCRPRWSARSRTSGSRRHSGRSRRARRAAARRPRSARAARNRPAPRRRR